MTALTLAILNDRGDRIEAVVPIDRWYELLEKIPPVELSERDESELAPINENEPKPQILADKHQVCRVERSDRNIINPIGDRNLDDRILPIL